MRYIEWRQRTRICWKISHVLASRGIDMRKIACCAIILSSSAFVAPVEGDEPVYSPQVGEVHADFVLPRIDSRKAVRLSDYRGKKVLLIHFASW